MKNLEVITDYMEFLNHYEWNDAELLHMCETVFEGVDTPPFKIIPAANSDINVILVYEPDNYGLIITPDVKKAIKAWMMQKTHNEPYDSYFSWKMAVEKED